MLTDGPESTIILSVQSVQSVVNSPKCPCSASPHAWDLPFRSRGILLSEAPLANRTRRAARRAPRRARAPSRQGASSRQVARSQRVGEELGVRAMGVERGSGTTLASMPERSPGTVKGDESLSRITP